MDTEQALRHALEAAETANIALRAERAGVQALHAATSKAYGHSLGHMQAAMQAQEQRHLEDQRALRADLEAVKIELSQLRSQFG